MTERFRYIVATAHGGAPRVGRASPASVTDAAAGRGLSASLDGGIDG